VIGIDAGGARKGFHAVALRAGATAGQLATTDVQELAHWCRAVIGARLIAIDAPCRWSADGRAPACERALNAAGHPLLRLAQPPGRPQPPQQLLRLDAAGRSALPAAGDQPSAAGRPAAGGSTAQRSGLLRNLSPCHRLAAHKRSQRTELLRQAGIDTTPLTSIDVIDAALCALAAQHLASGLPCQAWGEAGSGLIVVPQPAA